ncbi:MAG: N-formylglutamate amidohydrolase [Sphingomicrobium sp.]
MESTLSPPLIVPPRNGLPLLLSIPHSGREYPDWLLAEARHGRRALASLEDPLVDRLAWRAIAAGYGAVIARAPRGAIDCNRSVAERDPAAIVADPVTREGSLPVGPRARHGLGIVASRTQHHGALWRHPLSAERFAQRRAAVYDPYHCAISDGLEALLAAHGTALLLDLHSMPPRGERAARLIVGNRHGASAAPDLAHAATRIAEQAGFRAALNDPYAGGHIVERHGRPGAGVHALQIEIDRSAYLARDLASPGAGFDRISLLVLRLAEEMAMAVGGFGSTMTAIAAE